MLKYVFVSLLVWGYVSSYPLDAGLPSADTASAENHEPIPSDQVPPKELEKVKSEIQSDEVHEPVYPGEKEPPKAEFVPREAEVVAPSQPEVLASEEVKLGEGSGPLDIFSRYDEDGDGYIDIFEWERKIEDELAKKKFLDADVNDDDKISQEEYQVWSSPVEPQENVNEVYVPSDSVAQPVDVSEAQPPVGRSAEELSGQPQGEPVIVVSDSQLDSANQEQPAIVVEEKIQEQPLVLEPQSQDDASKVIAVIEEGSQPTIVLLEDEKREPEVPSVEAQPEVVKPQPEVVKPLPEVVKPQLKSVEEAKVIEPVEEQAQPQREQEVKVDLGVPVAIQSEVVKPDQKLKPEVDAQPEKKERVESQPEEVKPEETQPQPQILPAVEEAKPEKLPEIQPKSENLPEAVAQPEKLPEVQSEPEKVPEVQSQPEKLPEVQSQPEKVPEVQSEPEKVPEVQSEPEKVPEVLSQPEKVAEPKPELVLQLEKREEVESQPEKKPEEIQPQPEKLPEEIQPKPEKLPEEIQPKPEKLPEVESKPEVSSLRPEIVSEDNLKKEDSKSEAAQQGSQSNASEPSNTIGW